MAPPALWGWPCTCKLLQVDGTGWPNAMHRVEDKLECRVQTYWWVLPTQPRGLWYIQVGLLSGQVNMHIWCSGDRDAEATAYRQIIFRVLFQYRFHLDGWWSVCILVTLQFRQVTKCKSLSRGMILWCCVSGILLAPHSLGKQLKQILYTLQFLICFQRIMHIVIEDIPSKNKP